MLVITAWPHDGFIAALPSSDCRRCAPPTRSQARHLLGMPLHVPLGCPGQGGAGGAGAGVAAGQPGCLCPAGSHSSPRAAALLAVYLACHNMGRCGVLEYNVIANLQSSPPRAWRLPAAKQPHCCACQALQPGLRRRPRGHRCRLVKLHPQQSMAGALRRTHGGGNSTEECTQAGRQQ
jgi:hypothetical protein